MHIFFEKHKRVLFTILTVVLLFLVASSITAYASVDFEDEYFCYNETQFADFTFVSMNTDYIGEKAVYSSIKDADSQIHVGVPGGREFNYIELDLRSTEELKFVQIYYPTPDGGLSERCSVIARIDSENNKVVASIPRNVYGMVRIDIEGIISPTELRLMTRNVDVAYKPGLVSLIALVLIVGVLAVFEKKVGYFAYLKARIISVIDYFKCAASERRYAAFAVRAACLLFFVLLIVLGVVFLEFCVLYTAQKIIIFVLSLLCCVLYITDCVINKNTSAARMFLVIMLLIGFMMSCALPITSFNSWDEHIHYENSLDLRNLLFNTEFTYVDFNMANRNYMSENYYEPTYYQYTELLADDAVRIPTDKEFVNIYTYIGYLPVAIAMFVMDIVDANFVYMIVMSKMAMVATYALVIYFGLKRLKSGALIFASIALVPTAVFLTCSFSYDWWVTAFIIFFFAYFISFLQDDERKIKKGDIAILLTAFFLGCGPKAVYFLLALPTLFVSRKYFESDDTAKRYRICCIATMLVILLSFALPFLIDTEGQTDYRGGSDVNALEQVKFILSDVYGYIRILIGFLADYVSLGNSATYMGSYAYIGFTHGIYGTLSIVLIIACAFLDKDECDAFAGEKRIRAIGIISSFLTMCVVASALYVAFTPVGYPTVLGCQYRYIIPVLAPFMYFLGSGKLKNNMNRTVLNAIIYSLLVLNVFLSFYKVFMQELIM